MKKSALLEKKLKLEAKILEARKAQFSNLAIPSLSVDTTTNLEKIVEAFNAKFETQYTVDLENKKVFDMGSESFAKFSTLKLALENRNFKTKIVEYNEEGLHTLIENEVEKAQVVIAAQGILDKLQKVAEDIVKIQTEQVMPMVDQVKLQFGRDVADQFNAQTKEQLDAAFEAVRSAKDVIGNEVEKMNAVVNGEEYPTDLASDTVDDAGDDMGLGNDLGDEIDDELGGDGDDLELDFDDVDVGRELKA